MSDNQPSSLYISKIVFTCMICGCESSVDIPLSATPLEVVKITNEAMEECFDCADEAMQIKSREALNIDGLEPLERQFE